MIIHVLLLNLFIFISQCRRKFGGGGSRSAGIGKVTRTFGQGMATLIKELKEGIIGSDQSSQQLKEVTSNRFIDKQQYYKSIGNDTTFYVIVIIFTILIVIGILYYIVKVLPKIQSKNVLDEAKKKNQQNYKHYETIKFISENRIHPAKAFGKLQKIKHK